MLDVIKRVLAGEFGATLAAEGYVKKGPRAFYRKNAESLCFVNVQAGSGNSRLFGGKFTINLGVFLFAEVQLKNPQRSSYDDVDSYDILAGGMRLGYLVHGNDLWWHFEPTSDAAEISREVAKAWRTYARPYLDARSTLVGAGAAIEQEWAAKKESVPKASEDGIVVALAKGDRAEAERRLRAWRADFVLTRTAEPTQRGADIATLCNALEAVADYPFDLRDVFRRVDELDRQYALGMDADSAALFERVGQLWASSLDRLVFGEKAYLTALHLKRTLSQLARGDRPTILLTWPSFEPLRARLEAFVAEPERMGVFVRLLRALRKGEPLEEGLLTEATGWAPSAPADWIALVEKELTSCPPEREDVALLNEVLRLRRA